MPHLGSGEFFFGPDGKYRRVTMDLREDRDIGDIRHKAFNELAQSGVTWKELAQYPDDKPHPGEVEALAVREARRTASDNAAKAVDAHQMSDRFGPEKVKQDLARVAPDLGLDLAGDAAKWGLPPKESARAPILVATTDQAVSGLPREVERSQPFVTPSPLTSGQRRSFNEKLVRGAANENHRVAANDNEASASAQTASTRNERQTEETPTGNPLIAAGEAAEREQRRHEDRLFNWKRIGTSAPTSTEYAIYAVSDEGHFAYLEDMKDEWSRLLEQHPEEVFGSMLSEVEKLSNAAQRDFFTAHHETATPTQIAEMEDAITKMVFAPAEHWTKAGDKPNEKLVEAKPYIGVQRPIALTGDQLAEALTRASAKIAVAQDAMQGGRPGSLSTRATAQLITEKLAAAIKACGGKVSVELYGHKEPQIQRVRHQVKGSRYPDSAVPFEAQGRNFGAFASHYTPGADGITMNLREATQWDGLIENIGRAIVRGELGIEAAGVGAVRKQGPNESDEDYLKMIDDLVKDMIDDLSP